MRHELRDQLKSRAPELVDKVIEMALAGDTTALRICLERALPAYRPAAAPVTFDTTDESLTAQAQRILESVGQGTVTPDIGAQLIHSLAGLARMKEIDDLEKRIQALEQQ